MAKLCKQNDTTDMYIHQYKYVFSQAPTVSYDFVENDYNPTNYLVNHGQSCAGIIGAAHNNSICVVGIAYESNVGGKSRGIAISICLCACTRARRVCVT